MWGSKEGSKADLLREHLAVPKGKQAKGKIKKTMDEWKGGTLHSGSKTGPKVTNQKQAIAIALSQGRKAA